MGPVEDIDAAVEALDDYLSYPVPAPEYILVAWRIVRGTARRARRALSTSELPAATGPSALEAATAASEHAETAASVLDRKKPG